MVLISTYTLPFGLSAIYLFIYLKCLFSPRLHLLEQDLFELIKQLYCEILLQFFFSITTVFLF